MATLGTMGGDQLTTGAAGATGAIGTTTPPSPNMGATGIPGVPGAMAVPGAAGPASGPGSAWATPTTGGNDYGQMFTQSGQAPVTSVDQGENYQKTMQDAYWNQATSRLDPQWNQRQSGLESQLANMGLSRGTDAWNREMGNMSMQRNDAYGGALNSAILNSGAEAQRRQAMDIASGEFANKQVDTRNQLGLQYAGLANKEQLQSMQGEQALQQIDANNKGQMSLQDNKNAAALQQLGVQTQSNEKIAAGNNMTTIEAAHINAAAMHAAAAAQMAGMNAQAAASVYSAQLNAGLTAQRIANEEKHATITDTIGMQQNQFSTYQWFIDHGYNQTDAAAQAGLPATPQTANTTPSTGFIDPGAKNIGAGNAGTADMISGAVDVAGNVINTGIDYYNRNKTPAPTGSYGGNYVTPTNWSNE